MVPIALRSSGGRDHAHMLGRGTRRCSWMLLTNRGTPVAKLLTIGVGLQNPRASRLCAHQYGPAGKYAVLTGLVVAVLGVEVPRIPRQSAPCSSVRTCQRIRDSHGVVVAVLGVEVPRIPRQSAPCSSVRTCRRIRDSHRVGRCRHHRCRSPEPRASRLCAHQYGPAHK